MKSLLLSFALIAGLNANAYSLNTDLTWTKGTELMLFGHGDMKSVNNYLTTRSLEAVPQENGKALIALSPGVFEKSNHGPFSMTFMAINARPIGSSEAGNWYFMEFTISQRSISDMLISNWNVGSALGETKIQKFGEKYTAVSYNESNEEILKLVMATSSTSIPTNYRFVVYASDRSGETVSFGHDCNGSAANLPFNAAGGDSIQYSSASPIGQRLQEFGFKGAFWSFYKTSFGTFSTLPLVQDGYLHCQDQTGYHSLNIEFKQGQVVSGEYSTRNYLYETPHPIGVCEGGLGTWVGQPMDEPADSIRTTCHDANWRKSYKFHLDRNLYDKNLYKVNLFLETIEKSPEGPRIDPIFRATCSFAR